MHFSKKTHCAALKKNRSSDNFLIQKKYSDFFVQSPRFRTLRLCCIIRRPFFGRLGGTKQHFVEELEELDV